MSELLFGTGSGPLVALFLAHPLPFLIGALFIGLMIHGLIVPDDPSGAGDNIYEFGDSGDAGSSD